MVRAPDGRRRGRVDPEKFLSGRGSIVARLRRASEGTAHARRYSRFGVVECGESLPPSPRNTEKILVEG